MKVLDKFPSTTILIYTCRGGRQPDMLEAALSTHHMDTDCSDRLARGIKCYGNCMLMMNGNRIACISPHSAMREATCTNFSELTIVVRVDDLPDSRKGAQQPVLVSARQPGYRLD